METRAFAPLYAPTGLGGTPAGALLSSVTVAASTTAAASAQLPGGSPAGGGPQLQISNTTSAWAYVTFGVYGNVVASTVATGYPVAPGTVVVVSVHAEVTGASVILASGSGNVVFTRGEGV